MFVFDPIGLEELFQSPATESTRLGIDLNVHGHTAFLPQKMLAVSYHGTTHPDMENVWMTDSPSAIIPPRGDVGRRKYPRIHKFPLASEGRPWASPCYLSTNRHWESRGYAIMPIDLRWLVGG